MKTPFPGTLRLNNPWVTFARPQQTEGWSEARRIRETGIDHVMSDERILGDSEFVESVLTQASESYDRRYELKLRGSDLERIAERVAEVCGIGKEEVFSKGRQRDRVKARSLLCYWAVRRRGYLLGRWPDAWGSVARGSVMRWKEKRLLFVRIITS
jgi:hypothetical protein